MTRRTPRVQRDLLAYFIGFLAGDFASQMQSVAIGWHVFTLHHRTFDLGLVGLVIFVPTFALSLVAGLFADRHDRRTIVALTTATESACSLGFYALVVAGVSSIGPYLAILAVVGTARAFAAPAERSLLVNIVGPERLVASSALAASLREIVMIAGPAAGGLLVAVGASTAFVTTAVIFALAVAGYLLLRTRPGAAPEVGFTARDAFAGVRFILANPVIGGAISLDLVAVLFGGVTALLPVYADTILHVGPIGLGFLRCAPAIGAGLAAVFLARRPPRRSIGPKMFATVAGYGVATLVFAFSRNLALSLIALAAIGATDMLSVVIRIGVIQLNTPDAMRGRVTAAEAVFIGASNELGEFESGMLASLIGTVGAVVAGGVAALATVGLWTALFPQLRRADSLESKPQAAVAGPLLAGDE